MYFASRLQAGRMLAGQLQEKYGGSDCAVVALSDGGVMVGAQIAMRLRCVITMLLADIIELPRELIAIGGISQDGSFTFNKAFSSGEIEEMMMEYHGVVEQEKLLKLHEMHRMMKSGVLIRPDLLQDRHVILVSDGLTSGFSVDLAMEYVKPLSLKSLIIATPIATVSAVDRMHVLADDVVVLNVLENFISVDHYYDTRDVPDHEVVIKTIEHIVSNWK